MRWNSFIVGSGALALLSVAVPHSAQAATITGHLGFAGTGIYDTLDNTGGATIDFYDELTGTPDATAGDGQMIRLNNATGYFTGIVGYANIKDMTNSIVDVPPSTEVIPGFNYGPAGLANFISAFTDANFSGLHFDIEKLLLQQGNTCTGLEGQGDTCVEGPFSLTQTATGLDIVFDMTGWFRRTVNNVLDEGYYKGHFTVGFDGETFAGLFAKLAAGQDLVCGTATDPTPCEIRAGFDPTAVPEPATMLSFGLGSAVLAMVVRRRRAKV